MIALEQFENLGMNIWDITKDEYVKMKMEYMTTYYNELSKIDKNLNISELLENNKNEAEAYHFDNVREALRKGIKVSDRVLSDYKTLYDEVQKELIAEAERKSKQVKLTKELFLGILNNSKIKINGIKFTLKGITNDYIICREYRKRKDCKIYLNQIVDSFSESWC